MSSASNVRAGRAYVELGADDKSLTAALARAAGKVKAFGDAISGIGQKMLFLGSKVVAPLAIAAQQFGSMGDQLAKAARRTGVSVEALSELSYAARRSGTDMEGLEMGLRKMQKTIVSAAQGSGQATAALNNLGLSVDQLGSLSPEAQFKLIADRLAAIKDPTVKAAVAMEVFGKSGTSLIPMLSGGSALLEQYQARARALGNTMSTSSALAAEDFNARLGDLWDTLRNGAARIGEAVIPAMVRWVNAATLAVVEAKAWVSQHKELVQTVLKVGAGIAVAGAAVFAFGKVFSVVGGVVNGVLSAFRVVSGVFSGLFALFAAIASPIGIVIAALVGLGAYLVFATETGRVALASLGEYFKDLMGTANETIGGITAALSSGQWALAAEVAWAGVKLAFAQGIAPLRRMWEELKYAASVLFQNIGDNMVKAFIIGTSAAKDVWEKFKAWFDNLTTDIGDGSVRLLINAKEAAGKISANEADAQRRNLGQINQAAHSQINAERDAAIAANDAEAKARLANLDQVHQTAIDNIDKELEEGLTATEKDLARKTAALDALNALAQESKAKGENNPLFPSLPQLPSPDDFDGSLGELNRRTFGASGTFNAAGAFGLGGGSAAERTANATEATAKGVADTRRAIQQLSDLGLAFA